MRLLDSNIVIYATHPENEWLRKWLEAEPYVISQISRVEVLGYHRLEESERRDLDDFLTASAIMPLDEAAANRAIALRQQRKIALADALIAATALETGCKLVTRNVDDFRWIARLRLVNPFDLAPSQEQSPKVLE